MRGILQRVSRARVVVSSRVCGEIGTGIMLLAGFGHDDLKKDLEWMLEKVVNLRIFEDRDHKMNLSLIDTEGSLLVVPQFTLHGDCRRGRRPSFSSAAPPEIAGKLFTEFIQAAKNLPLPVASGIFQADMEVELVNQGPVTILLDSKKQF